MKEPVPDWARLQVVKNQPRSVSQAQQYLEELGGCKYRYFLARVIQAWDRPAAWLAQGLAVHEAAEWWERTGRTHSLTAIQGVYKAAYHRHIRRLLDKTPNADTWFDSGFRYPGAVDIRRRAMLGLEQIERYYNYYVNQKPGEVVWVTPTGEPAIELEFSEYFGGVLVRGYIDQIVDEIMRDIKTGTKPGGIFQLATYRYAIMSKYGVDFAKGDFWMGKTGKPTNTFDLTKMTREQVTELFESLDSGVKAEDFEPSPSPEKCGRCGVRTGCPFSVGNDERDEVPFNF